MPWHCVPEQGEWEECCMQDYYRRMRQLERQRRAKIAEESTEAISEVAAA